MNPAISKVTQAEEVAAVASLAEQIWREHFTAIIGADQVAYMLEKYQSPTAIASQLSNGTEYYMAQVDGNPVGYTAIIPDRSNSRMMISKLYVRRDRRGGGVGAGLLAHIEQECEKRQLGKLWLTVNRFNDGPIQWYLRRGFHKVDEVKKAIGGGFYMDDFIMEKYLSRRKV
jgi:N-acetylglutamate synthase-like GNAT family acetyltransferase